MAGRRMGGTRTSLLVAKASRFCEAMQHQALPQLDDRRLGVPPKVSWGQDCLLPRLTPPSPSVAEHSIASAYLAAGANSTAETHLIAEANLISETGLAAQTPLAVARMIAVHTNPETASPITTAASPRAPSRRSPGGPALPRSAVREASPIPETGELRLGQTARQGPRGAPRTQPTVTGSKARACARSAAR